MSAFELLLLLGFKTAILSLAAILAWGLLKLFRSRSPKIHRSAWGLVLLLGVLGAGLPVSIHVPEPSTPESENVPLQTASIVSETSEPDLVETAFVSPPLITHEAEESFELSHEITHGPLTQADISYQPTAVVPEPQAPAPLPTAHSFDWNWLFTSLVYIWFTGIFGLIIWRFVLHFLLFYRLRTANPVQGEALLQWNELLDEYRLQSRNLPLLLTNQLGPGLVWRSFRGSAILVPRDLWEEATPDVREGILRHELAHYRNGDMVRSGIARLSTPSLHWDP